MLQIEPYNTNNVEEYILKLEQDLNIILPKDYKQFLIKYNGGWTPGTEIYFDEFDHGINGFNGVNKAEGSSNFNYFMNEANDIIRDEFFEDLKNGFLNIGGDLGPHYYINIDINSDKYGAIYFMYRDYEIEKQDYIYVCSSFKELTQKARTPDFKVYTVKENIQRFKENGWEDRITPSLKKEWRKRYKKYKDLKLVPVIID